MLMPSPGATTRLCTRPGRHFRALRRLFGRELVQSGSIEPEWARILGVEQDRRIAADYNTEVVWEAEMCEQLLNDAQRFLDRIAGYLAQEGHDLSPQSEGEGGG